MDDTQNVQNPQGEDQTTQTAPVQEETGAPESAAPAETVAPEAEAETTPQA